MVVGPEAAIKTGNKYLVISLKPWITHLHPYHGTRWCSVGNIPFTIPDSQGRQLGLAGGLLIVSRLIGRFGPKLHLNTCTTLSANLIGEKWHNLFLASVGLSSGTHFVETVFTTNGLIWVGMGLCITIVPLLIVGSIARGFLKMNYFEIMGLLAGSTTDPPALAYANQTSNNDLPAVAYSTVYPVTMFLRVLTAQLLILIFA
jgi:putative transport protein